MVDNLMIIPNDTAKNFPFYGLQLVDEMRDTLNKPTNLNLFKFPKVV